MQAETNCKVHHGSRSSTNHVSNKQYTPFIHVQIYSLIKYYNIDYLFEVLYYIGKLKGQAFSKSRVKLRRSFVRVDDFDRWRSRWGMYLTTRNINESLVSCLCLRRENKPYAIQGSSPNLRRPNRNLPNGTH